MNGYNILAFIGAVLIFSGIAFPIIGDMTKQYECTLNGQCQSYGYTGGIGIEESYVKCVTSSGVIAYIAFDTNCYSILKDFTVLIPIGLVLICIGYVLLLDHEEEGE